jgi:putative phage-type endonuclease
MIQGSDAWFAARLGKVTASRVCDVVAKTKTGWGASRANYAAELIAERLTGVTAPSFMNDAMRWGTETEPRARDAYAQHLDLFVEQIGFVDHPEVAMSGASPDGLVGADGMVEIKCPNTATHLDTLDSGAIPAKYVTQIQWQLACTGRAWCDFVSYDPRLPPEMALFVKRLDRDVSMIVDLETEVSAFLRELGERVERLRSRYGQRVAAAA